ncbi:MAG: hypothetical protein HYX24_06835 [Candidatus Aenigmarchaeota archaeon]|nr:hypothetical protein [Candidatus Aenigmarchaeota archaeon]
MKDEKRQFNLTLWDLVWNSIMTDELDRFLYEFKGSRTEKRQTEDVFDN